MSTPDDTTAHSDRRVPPIEFTVKASDPADLYAAAVDDAKNYLGLCDADHEHELKHLRVSVGRATAYAYSPMGRVRLWEAQVNATTTRRPDLTEPPPNRPDTGLKPRKRWFTR